MSRMRGDEMKRWALRICVFLMLGAIVNVAVAWGCAASSRLRAGPVSTNAADWDWLRDEGWKPLADYGGYGIGCRGGDALSCRLMRRCGNEWRRGSIARWNAFR